MPKFILRKPAGSSTAALKPEISAPEVSAPEKETGSAPEKESEPKPTEPKPLTKREQLLARLAAEKEAKSSRSNCVPAKNSSAKNSDSTSTNSDPDSEKPGEKINPPHKTNAINKAAAALAPKTKYVPKKNIRKALETESPKSIPAKPPKESPALKPEKRGKVSSANYLEILKQRRKEKKQRDAEAAKKWKEQKQVNALSKVRVNPKFVPKNIQAKLPQVKEALAAKESIPDSIPESKSFEAKEIPAAQQKPDSVSGDYISKSEITEDMLNDRQRQAVEFTAEGKSFIVTGGAGSGKTTVQRIATQRKLDDGTLSRLSEVRGHKRLAIGAPSMVIISFTNRAVENIRDVVSPVFKPVCMTAHKLLQFAPEKVLRKFVDDDGIEQEKEVTIFSPTFNADNKLPHIETVIIEEASNFDNDTLFRYVIDALPHPGQTQFIFIGDINQLKPVFGISAMIAKFTQIPIVALNHVYRQGITSKIKLFAMAILEGKPLRDSEVLAFEKPGEFEPLIFKKRVEAEDAIDIIGDQLGLLVERGDFIPGRDIVLTPYNEGSHVNVHNMNRHIADKIRRLEDLEIYEIFARMKKFYIAVGDHVTVSKRQWVIKSIAPNPDYFGLPTREPNKNIDRWGVVIDDEKDAGENSDFDALLARQFEGRHTAEQEEEEQKNQASHIIILESTNDIDPDDPFAVRELTIKTAGDFDDFDFGYATTIHKSQGSEWHTVIMILHHSQMNMASRELLYTGVTRARVCLKLWFDGENKNKLKTNTSWLQRGIVNQQIPGKTIDEKIEYIKKEQLAEQQGTITKIKMLPRKAKRLADSDDPEDIRIKLDELTDLAIKEHESKFRQLLESGNLPEDIDPVIKTALLDFANRKGITTKY